MIGSPGGGALLARSLRCSHHVPERAEVPVAVFTPALGGGGACRVRPGSVGDCSGCIRSGHRPRERVVLGRIREGDLHHLRRFGGLAGPCVPRDWPHPRWRQAAPGYRKLRSPARLCWTPPGSDLSWSGAPLSRDRRPGPGQGPSLRLLSRDAWPVCVSAPRHRSQRAGLSPSRRPGTSGKLRNLRR